LFLEANHYVGIAPVPFEHYRRYMLAFQQAAPRSATRDRVREAFSHLVISQHVLDQLGPAINAGHSMFVYGLEPLAVYALSNLCYLSFLQGDFDQAVTTCRSALAVDPGFTAARNNLALAHAAAGRLDLAQTEFMDAGDEALGLFNMGIVHMAVRDYHRAVAAFDAASRSNPFMAVARERAVQARQFARSALHETTGDPK
jgi:tetratricopeptide (TPR) repeat protein